MNYTASQYTGARAATFTATMDGASVAVQVGSESVLQAAVVHLGLKGEPGDIVADPLAYYILAKN